MLDRVARFWMFDPVEGALVLPTLALCIDVFVAVVLRYVFHTSLGFYDELARHLFVSMSFLGAAAGVKRHGHFGVSGSDESSYITGVALDVNGGSFMP